jgi:cytidine deaminase
MKFEHIEGWTAAAVSIAREALIDGPFIPKDALGRIKALNGQEDTGEIMIQLLPTAAAYARSPISSFTVGAVAEGSTTGNLYLGASMEFPTQALSFVTHGEQSATNTAWQAGEEGIASLAVNAAPCGYCRQFLYEITTAQTGLDILLKANEDPDDYSYTRAALTTYLPAAFGPEDLGMNGALMEPQDHGLTISSADDLAQAALAGANASYAPYSSNFSGVALRLANGNIYSGSYAENAAYNPSMSPLESALSNMNMGEAAQDPYQIVQAVLVESVDSQISQKPVTEDVLSSVAPGVVLEYLVAA